MRRNQGLLALCYLPEPEDTSIGPSMKGYVGRGQEKKGQRRKIRRKNPSSIQDAQKKQTKGTEATGGKNQSEKREREGEGSTTGQGFVAFYFYWLFRYGSIKIGNEQ